MAVRVRINAKNYKAYHGHRARLGTAPHVPGDGQLLGSDVGRQEKGRRRRHSIRTLSRLSETVIIRKSGRGCVRSSTDALAVGLRPEVFKYENADRRR